MPNKLRIAVTGHRLTTLNDLDQQIWVRRRLRSILQQALDFYGNRVILASGMALGVDTWWAEEAVLLGIPIEAYLPFAGQADGWSDEHRRVYHDLLQNATAVSIVSENGYTGPRDNWKYYRRNEVMCNASNMLVAVWNGDSKGGTAGCVRYWRKHHSKHLWVHPISREVFWTRKCDGWPDRPRSRANG